ncbi:hypothetical protein ILUMI_26922 [Ignelater luminosus]|uniref:MULE transposase domain-containing protein n=1 Tax=Ignelater luminosus TaxID=2038154 RepID=A0A8K0C8Y6_IGNLU|nr:hypothetical protein ILUMI_26922 [Ignelater luminosus]
MPTNPQDINKLKELPGFYKKILTGDDFLLYDSRDHENEESTRRIFIFGTKDNLRRLMRSSNWFAGETFKLNKLLHFRWCMLYGKIEAAYKKVFVVVNAECDRFGIPRSMPVTMMTDFEIAIINAAETVGSHVRACFFHLRQCIFRHIQAEGLQQTNNDPEHRSIKQAVQMMCATAFVSIDKVNDGFDVLMDLFPELFLPTAGCFEVYTIYNYIYIYIALYKLRQRNIMMAEELNNGPEYVRPLNRAGVRGISHLISFDIEPGYRIGKTRNTIKDMRRSHISILKISLDSANAAWTIMKYVIREKTTIMETV